MMKESIRLRRYLFEEVVSYFEKLRCPGERYRYLEAKGVMKNAFLAKISAWTVPFFQKYAIFKRKRIDPKHITVLFYADPMAYSHIVSTLVEHTNIMINNPFRCSPITINREKNVIFLPLFVISKSLVDGIRKNKREQVLQSLCELRSILQKAAPEIMVVNDAIHPMNRALIWLGKELRITTVELQHAVYPKEMLLIEGFGADYVFVWGDIFRQMYLDQQIRSSDSIKIMGYPHELGKIPIDVQKKSLTLCYLAQGFQYEDIGNLDILLENAIKLRSICEQNGLQFRCRLHPNSPSILLKKILPVVECVPRREKLIDTIKGSDIFISFNSTSLIEAALNGKHCIQLKNINVVTDDFEKLGICPRSFRTIDEVEIYLRQLAKKKAQNLLKYNKPINPRYIEIPKPDAGTRFFELMQDITNKSR